MTFFALQVFKHLGPTTENKSVAETLFWKGVSDGLFF